MSIKLDVNINDFILSNDCPRGLGDLVFAWDEDKCSLVVGIHRGFSNKFNESTGKCIKHSHLIEVLSWEKPDVVEFAHAQSYHRDARPRVITPDGTGRFGGADSMNMDRYLVHLDRNIDGVYPKDQVKLFTWSLVDAKDKDDKPTA